jgi:hypothetical protein
MRFKPKRRRQEPACTTGTYRVQLLDAQENGLKNMEAAEEHLRQTLPPTDSSSLTVALIDESPDRHNYVQFDIEPT